jgi:hypothetical protein
MVAQELASPGRWVLERSRGGTEAYIGRETDPRAIVGVEPCSGLGALPW